MQATAFDSDAPLTARFTHDVIPLVDRLYRCGLRMTGSPADAEDLVHDTVLRAYAAFPSFRQETHLRAWLFRIMHNSWVNNYRTARQRPSEYFSGEIADWQLAAQDWHAVAGLRSAEVEALEAMPDTEFATALAALPNDLRMAIHYAYVEGLGYKEIAQIMDTPVGTVMARLHRARAHLRMLLADLARERGFTGATSLPHDPSGN